MRRLRLEVADVFHRHGADWRRANAGHVSLGQLQVMSAIERCRSAGMSSVAGIAATAASLTTLVATAIAQSVGARWRRIGSRRARPICCRSAISTWSSRCPPRSPRSPTRTTRRGLRPAVPHGGRNGAHDRCQSTVIPYHFSAGGCVSFRAGGRGGQLPLLRAADALQAAGFGGRLFQRSRPALTGHW